MKPRLVRFLKKAILVVAVGLLALAAPIPTAAIQPYREYIPIGPSTITGVCSFDVLVEPNFSNLYAMTYYDEYGNVTMVINSGAVILTLTNLSTYYAITVNISGPGRWVYNLDGSGTGAWMGPWLIQGDPNSYFGWPPLVVFSGRVSYSWDTNGTVYEATSHGHYIDICAELGE